MSLSNTIVRGDCLDVMKEIPDGVADLILTDPPYGMNYRSGFRKEGDPIRREIENDNQSYLWQWSKDITAEMARILKPRGVAYIFCTFDRSDYQSYSIWSEATRSSLKLKNCLIWDKQYFALGWNYRYQHEFILYAVKGAETAGTWNGGHSQSNILRFSRVSAAKMLHPTHKPGDLISLLIANSSNPGDLIVDPFLGSGETAVQAKKLGRRYVGIELDAEHVKVAQERLWGPHINN